VYCAILLDKNCDRNAELLLSEALLFDSPAVLRQRTLKLLPIVLSLGGLASDDSDDDEEDDDYNPEADRVDNECENISEVGYDTDELSYDGIEEGDEESPGVSLRLFGDSSPGDTCELEGRERGMVLEEDSDLERDIDSDEIGQLLDEAGDPLVESVTVAGRRLRPRSSKEAAR
jgi:hypothetical protein